MIQRKSLATWVDVLTGIEPDRCAAALDEVETWGFPHVAAELVSDTVDAAVAATLLVEGIDRLAEHGVSRERLLKKLRTGDLWSTWAEIRVAVAESDLREEPRERWRHPLAESDFVVGKSDRLDLDGDAVGGSRELKSPVGMRAGGAPSLEFNAKRLDM